MKHSLEQVFQQSKLDDYAITLDGDGYESRMVYGIKIVRDNETKAIQLLNTMVGGDYYKELTHNQLEVFLDKGWRIGVYVVALSNYRSKLILIEQKIHRVMNGNKSEKQIKSLKGQRTRIMNQYTEINQKFNQLNLNQNGNEVNNNNKEEADNL